VRETQRAQRQTLRALRMGRNVSTYKNMSRLVNTPNHTKRSKLRGTFKKLVTLR